MRSLALYAHFLGMAALFAALVVEWTAVGLVRTGNPAEPSAFATGLLRRLPRFTGIAGALILASGISMAAQFGVLRSAWVSVSFAAMVLMAGLGGVSLRPLIRSIGHAGNEIGALAHQASSTFLHMSFHARIAVALAIVYLMVAKPDLPGSAAVVTFALLVGAIAGIIVSRSSVTAEPAKQDRQAVPRAMEGSR